MGPVMPVDADRIAERLLYALRDARHDDVFSGASAVDLVLRIRDGAKTMVDQERTSEDDLAEATENLLLALAEMDEARVRFGLTEFQELTVSEAFVKLCPGFWPFC